MLQGGWYEEVLVITYLKREQVLMDMITNKEMHYQYRNLYHNYHVIFYSYMELP